MKATVMKPTQIDIRFIDLILPVKYDEEDMPNDFPFRKGDMWQVTVEIDTGRILDWPDGVSHDLYMKVTDAGSYVLRGPDMLVIADVEEDYVPHGVVPGEYGDYVALNIRGDGWITNWPTKPDVSEFFAGDDA